jgi:glycosyltransferase involved in cell wall biosynthesis
MFVSLGGTYPFLIGGPQVVAYNLVKQFDRKGVNVDFVFGISREHLERRKIYDHFHFSENVRLLPVVKNWKSPSAYSAALDGKFLVDMALLEQRMCDAPDIVQFMANPASKDILLLPSARLRRIPSVVKLPGWLTFEVVHKRDAAYVSYLCYRLLKHYFTKIVCSSSYLKDKVILEGVDPSKIETIPNGVDMRWFEHAAKIDLIGHPALLFVGRLEPEKGVDILVESMKELLKILPEAVLHIVGSGSLGNELRRLTASDGLEDNVILHGETADTPRFYKSADVCVFPSLIETFGNTALEAMAAGKPVVATRRGGVPEFLTHFENGLLVEPDREELVDAITTLWHDDNLMHRISKNNLEKAKRFDWSNVAEQYVKLYEAIT